MLVGHPAMRFKQRLDRLRLLGLDRVSSMQAR